MATHEGVVTIFPDVGWKALQQLEPVVLELPKYIQNRSCQGFAYCRESHYCGFRIQGREDTCDSFDDTFLLKQLGDPTSLRPRYWMKVGSADDLVAGVGHIRRIVVVDECGNSMDLDSRG